MLLLDQPPELAQRRQFGTFSDFDKYVSADEFTLVATDAGTATVSDAAGGILALAASDASTKVDNDEAYLKGTHEIFKIAADNPLVFEARVKPAATALGTANFIVGVKDAVAANTLVDDGGGPAASYDGAVFYAVDGGSYWVCESSNATAQTTVTTDKSFSGGVYQTLRIEVIPISSTYAEVHFFIDGEEVGLNNGNCHLVALASQTEIQICLGVKDGAAANSAVLNIDYVGCWQLR